MTTIRSPMVAGRFYPADPTKLRDMVGAFLEQAKAVALPGPVKGLIVPHAGYAYSGPVAASGYLAIRQSAALYKRVVLMGTSHTGVEGMATTGVDEFDSPLGAVKVDEEACRRIERFSQVRRDEPAHRVDHALEVQVPFLKLTLEDFAMVPLLVGKVSPEEVAEVLDELWDGPETLFVVSSDLSHYQDDATARKLDAETAGAIVGMQDDRIGHHQACGHRAIAGFLLAGKKYGLTGRMLDLRNSGEMGGSKREVVGYGTFAFFERGPRQESPPEGDIARVGKVT